MPRIRSVHPGMATDEAFMAMSMAAKAAWPLLWTECDDQGVFEWKPLVLKARIFPADNLDFAEVLSELERLDCVNRFEFDGKKYGAVRNFRKFQRPKTPNSTHPLPDNLRNFVGLSALSSEAGGDERASFPPKGETFPQKGENPSQMEDEGGRRIEEMRDARADSPSTDVSRETENPRRDQWAELETRLREAAGWQREPSPSLAVVGPVIAALEAGVDLDLDLLPAARAHGPRITARTTWTYILKAAITNRNDRLGAAADAAKPISPTRGNGHGKPDRTGGNIATILGAT